MVKTLHDFFCSIQIYVETALMLRSSKPQFKLTNPVFEIKFNPQPMQASQAEVAELADALRSGRSESNLMRVQVPPSAPNVTR